MTVLIFINPNQDRPFGEHSRIGRWQKGPVPKSCHTYLAMKKLNKVITYLKKNLKYIQIMWRYTYASIFSWETAHFGISRNTGIGSILIHSF